MTRVEATGRFRAWFGYDQFTAPPRDVRIDLRAIEELVRCILGTQWVKIIFPDDPAYRFTSTTVGLIRRCWENRLGDDGSPDVPLLDEDINAFLMDLARTSAEVEAVCGELDRLADSGHSRDTYRPSSPPEGVAEIQQGRYGWWKTDPDFLLLEAALLGADLCDGTAAEAFDAIDISELEYEISVAEEIDRRLDDTELGKPDHPRPEPTSNTPTLTQHKN